MDIPPELREQVMRLPADARIALAMELWASIPDDPRLLPVPEWQKRELDRRWALHQENPRRGRQWREVEARTLRDLGEGEGTGAS